MPFFLHAMIISVHIDFGSSASTASWLGQVVEALEFHTPSDVAGESVAIEDAFETDPSAAFASVGAFAVTAGTFAAPVVAASVAFDAVESFVATEDSFAVDSVEAQTFQRIAVVG